MVRLIAKKRKSRYLSKRETRIALDQLRTLERGRMKLRRKKQTRERRRLIKVARKMRKELPHGERIIVQSFRSAKPTYRTKQQALKAAKPYWSSHTQFIRKTKSGWRLYRYVKD